MTDTPIGAAYVKVCAGSLTITTLADVPPGATLSVIATSSHLMSPITAEAGTLNIPGGITLFGTPMATRVFTVACPLGLVTGSTIQVDLNGAGQGGTTPAWAQAYFS